jgi:hypothetical protein
VQGRAKDQRDLLDVESVAGHLVKPGSVSRRAFDDGSDIDDDGHHG